MKQTKQITIYDVAQKAGVSSATVSRVLNEPDKVAIDKRNKVLEAIKELKFVPKADAVANARKSYKKIGVVAPFFTQPSFMERLRGITAVLAAEHYEVVIYTIYTEEDLTNYVASLVNSNRVDGLIFLCVSLNENLISILHDASFPVCFVEKETEGFDCVVVDNVKGGRKAAEYLYDIGCTTPGFIGEKSHLNFAVRATEDRFLGYKAFFEEKGIQVSDENVWIGEFMEQKLDDEIEKFLNKDKLPDCVFCSSDVIASRFIRLAREHGVQIPSQIKVLGFDDIDIADHIGLSSVNQNLDESGKQAGELVIARIKDPEKAVVSMSLQLKIMERNTTKN